MHGKLFFAGFLCLFLLIGPNFATAEESQSVEKITVSELATAINAWAGDAQWWECGAPIKTRQERALEYANEFATVAENHHLSSLMMAAIVEQESGYDQCQVGGPTRQRVGLSRHPSYEEVYAELGTREKRRAKGISYFDAGAAQFLWPRASAFNATDGVPLKEVMTSAWSIATLGSTLSVYRQTALDKRRNGYTFRTSSGKSVHVSAEAGFFIHHNSPNASNHQYFWSVRSRGLRLLKVIQEMRSATKAASILRPFSPRS